MTSGSTKARFAMSKILNTGSGDLSVLSLIDRKGKSVFPKPPSLETMIPLGNEPRAIAVKAFVGQR